MFWKKCVKPKVVLKVMGVTGVLVLSMTACGSDSDTSDASTTDSSVVDESAEDSSDSSVVEDIVDTVLGDEPYSFTLEGCMVTDSQDGLFIVEDTINSLKGVVDNQGNEILSCTYDSIAFTYNEDWQFLIVQYGDYYGVMDYSGNELYPCEYTYVQQNISSEGVYVVFLRGDSNDILIQSETNEWKTLAGNYSSIRGADFLVSDEGVYTIDEELICMFIYEYSMYGVEYINEQNAILIYMSNNPETYTGTEGLGLYNTNGECIWELSDAYVGTYSSISYEQKYNITIWAEAGPDTTDYSILKWTYVDLVTFEYVDEPVTYESESEDEVEPLYVEPHGTTYQIFNDQGVAINDELYMEAEVSDDYNYATVQNLDGNVLIINAEGTTIVELSDISIEAGMSYDWFRDYFPYYATDDYVYIVDDLSKYYGQNIYVYPNK